MANFILLKNHLTPGQLIRVNADLIEVYAEVTNKTYFPNVVSLKMVSGQEYLVDCENIGRIDSMVGLIVK